MNEVARLYTHNFCVISLFVLTIILDIFLLGSGNIISYPVYDLSSYGSVCLTARVASDGYEWYLGIVSDMWKDLVLWKGGDVDRLGNGVRRF